MDRIIEKSTDRSDRKDHDNRIVKTDASHFLWRETGSLNFLRKNFFCTVLPIFSTMFMCWPLACLNYMMCGGLLQVA